MELEPDLCPACGDGLTHLRLLLGGGAIFLRQVFAQVLSTRAHVRVQLERLKVQIGLHFAIQALQGFFKGTQAYSAPRAGNVGDKIDFQRGHETLSGKALDIAANHRQSQDMHPIPMIF
jgi:hypothetical protein